MTNVTLKVKSSCASTTVVDCPGVRCKEDVSGSNGRWNSKGRRAGVVVGKADWV